MKTLISALLLATPASAETLPYATGDLLVQDRLLDGWTGKVHDNPLPEPERGCYRVEEVTAESIWLRLIAGYHDMNDPFAPVDPNMPPMEMPPRAPVGTGTGYAADDGIFAPCEPPDTTGMRTVSTVCELERLYRVVESCEGRPIPED